MTARPSPRLRTVRANFVRFACCFAFVLGLGYAPAACSSGSDHHPPSVVDHTGTSAAAGRTVTTAGGGPSGGSGANDEAGDTSSNAGESAAGQSVGGANDGGTGRATPGPALCSKAANWSGAAKVPVVSTTSPEQLLSITPDELDLAFSRGDALYVAHRATPTGAFTVGDAIPVPLGWSSAQGVALSADGKRLVLISSDQRALGELTRADRSSTFSSEPDQDAFTTVNQGPSFSGNIYSAPVLSADDQQLFLSSLAPGGASTVVASTRSPGEVWTAPTRVIAALDGSANARRLPTAISADGRTLFYFNEQTMKEEARWRDEPQLNSPLYDMVDLGVRRGAQPNAACDRLYSIAAGDVVVEQN